MRIVQRTTPVGIVHRMDRFMLLRVRIAGNMFSIAVAYIEACELTWLVTNYPSIEVKVINVALSDIENNRQQKRIERHGNDEATV